MKSSIGTLAAGATNPESLGKLIAPNWDHIAPEEMDHFLNGLDSAMNKIAVDPGGGQFLSKLINKPPSVEEAQLFRGGMRSLLLIGNFGDLSVEGQVHPGMQKRLKYSAPELGSAVGNLIDKMKSLSPNDRADIKSALRQDSNLGDGVLEAIDLEAGFSGASKRRRRQLQAMGSRILKRLKHSPDMVIDEYLTKCEKLTSMPDTEVETRRFMAARMGERAANARIQEAEIAVRRWQKMELLEVPIGYQPLQLVEEGEEPSDDRYKKGLRLLGIGAITTAAGWVLIGIAVLAGAIETGGVIGLILGGAGIIAGVTVGPLLILIALIILLVQAIIGPKK